jgi:hypothetical protein
MNIQILTPAERAALAEATGIAPVTLRTWARAQNPRWPSAELAQIVEAADPRLKCGDLCPVCAGCPYFKAAQL